MAITYKSFVGDAAAMECVELAGSMPSNELTITAGPHSKSSYACAFSSAAVALYQVQHMTQAGTAAGYSFAITGGLQHLVQQFAFYMTDIPADPIVIGFFDADGSAGGTGVVDSARPVYFSIMTDGKVRLTAADFTTTLQTSTNALAVDTWHYFLAIADMDTAADTYRVRLVLSTGTSAFDPVFDLSAGIIDHTATGATGGTGPGTWYFYVTNNKGAVNPACTFYFDDMVMYEVASDADIRTNQWLLGQQALPDGLGADVDWTNGPAGPAHPAVANVDDLSSGNVDDATTYDEATILGTTKEQTYSVAALSPTLVGREIVAVVQAIRKDGVAGAAIQHRVREQGTTTNIAGTDTSTPWNNTCQKMLTPPSGGVWTEAIINAADMGVKRANTTSTGQLSAIAWVVWTWSPIPEHRAVMRGVGRGVMRGVG